MTSPLANGRSDRAGCDSNEADSACPICDQPRTLSDVSAREAIRSELIVEGLRSAEKAADLRRRIDRTLDYTDEITRLGNLPPELVTVLRAVHDSLCTPVITPEET